MKNFFVAILAFLYISTSTGAFVHVHYCMGELADWGIGYNKSTKCGKCGMKEVQGNNNGLSITLQSVNDSRCPINALCISAGNARVKLRMSDNSGAEVFSELCILKKP